METSLNIFLEKLLSIAAKRQASHIHLAVGSYPMLRVDDDLVEFTDEQITTDQFVRKLADFMLDGEQKKVLEEQKSLTFARQIGKKFRVKINFFFQKKFLSASFQLIPAKTPALMNLGLPKSVYALVERKAGLVVVAGPYGSGRTTTVAAMIEEINKTRRENIITVEQPIEYLFPNQQSLVEQREVGRDTHSFANAIRSAQNTDVDVLVLGSTQDKEALPLVLEFAASGRLAIITMDTTSVVQSIEYIFASFPASEQQRAQVLLAESLLAVIVQRLVPRTGGGLVLAAEVLVATDAVRSLIREGRTKQLPTVIQSSRAEGMMSMDQSLANLVKAEEVLLEQAMDYATDPKSFRAMARS